MTPAGQIAVSVILILAAGLTILGASLPSFQFEFAGAVGSVLVFLQKPTATQVRIV
jgi:hypothetical protein